MSWELTSFLILGGVLVAGFAWYERSRPSSQVVALVAALAALAIVGRIAFAAFPNVKPTTDIVVFAGYALGGAPGFAVGALTALVSNFWFGQGPWTPWQMAAWGLCGVIGAGLSLAVRDAGRLALAATCGFAAIFYGALLNFSLMATYGGDLSWKHFWVLEGRAVPFEVAHLAGNVALALVAGPAMVRMLARFRDRFEWRRADDGRGGEPVSEGWLRSGGIAAVLLALTFLALAPAPAQASPVSRAAAWLEAQQRPSGGFAADSGREAGVEMTSWAMLALAASGRNPLDVIESGKSPVDFLRSHLGEVEDAGDVARTILALEAVGVDPREFGGEDLVSRLLAQRRQNGSYQGWPASSAYAVLALRSADADDATAATVAWLRKVQGEDGGWGNEPGGPSTAEITGGVLQVLTPGAEASDRALDYMRKAKRPNGGFAPGRNLSANAQATAWAVQGLLASGKDPAYFGDGKSSFAYLRDLQADDGHFLQAPGQEASPVWVTSDALVALSGNHLPIAAPPRAPPPKEPAAISPSHSLGGVPPSTIPRSGGAAAVPGPAGSEGLGGSSAGGALPGSSAPGGKGAAPIPLPEGSFGAPLPEGDLGTAPGEASALQYGEQIAEVGEDDSNSSSGGAIVLGLLAGSLLFGLGLAARRGWMRWRYGL
jgi:energy-coupling factor transport system substrate-specific component